MTADPTPTHAAPNWRELCRELLAQCDAGEMALVEAMEDIRAALATTPPAPTREAAPVPTDADLYDLAEVCNGEPVSAMRRALELWGRSDTREAAPGAEIGDEELLQTYGKAKRDHCYEGPIDDWPKRAERAAIICGLRAVWARAQAAREAAPLPQAPTDEDLDDLCAEFSFLTDDDESRDSLIEMFRTVLARWGGAAVPVPVSEPVGFFPVEYADADGEGIRILMEPADETGRVCWTVRNSRHVNPCREFATPEEAYAAHRTAADQQEGRAAAGEVQP
jgi:hypothetical protein